MLVLIAALLVVRVVLAAAVPLTTDEAYYWTWAKHPALSYLDHPPMIAYLIAATTRWSPSPLAVRAAPLVLNLAATALVYLIGRELFGRAAAVRASAVFQLTPMFVVGGVVAAPDVPLAVSWIASVYFAWLAVTRTPRWWVAAGLAIGLGLLSKLTIVVLVLGLAIFFLMEARRRTQPRIPNPESRIPNPVSLPWLLAGLVLAAVLFAPVVVWNAAHAWAGARFVLADRPPIARTGLPGLSDLGLSLALFTSPLLLPLLGWALWRSWRERRDPAMGLLWWTSAPIVAITLLLAAVNGSAQWHWAAPGFAGATLALARRWPRRIGRVAVALCAAMLGLILVFALAPTLVPGVHAFDEFLGWDRAAERAAELAERDPRVVFFCGDRFRSAAQLAYHTREARPVTILPAPPQGSVWPDPSSFAGADAVCVTDARWPWRFDPATRFARVEEQPPLVVTQGGGVLRTFRIFVGHDFRPVRARASGPHSPIPDPLVVWLEELIR